MKLIWSANSESRYGLVEIYKKSDNLVVIRNNGKDRQFETQDLKSFIAGIAGEVLRKDRWRVYLNKPLSSRIKQFKSTYFIYVEDRLIVLDSFASHPHGAILYTNGEPAELSFFMPHSFMDVSGSVRIFLEEKGAYNFGSRAYPCFKILKTETVNFFDRQKRFKDLVITIK